MIHTAFLDHDNVLCGFTAGDLNLSGVGWMGAWGDLEAEHQVALLDDDILFLGLIAGGNKDRAGGGGIGRPEG